MRGFWPHGRTSAVVPALVRRSAIRVTLLGEGDVAEHELAVSAGLPIDVGVHRVVGIRSEQRVDEGVVDGQDRVAVFQQLAKKNADNAFINPLFTPDADYAVNSDINWKPRADGEFVLSDITFTK